MSEFDIHVKDLPRFCFCCQRVQPEPIGPEGVCPDCEKDQKWYETGRHSVHEKLRIEIESGKVDIHQVVQILPHAQGWVVNGQKIEK